MTITARFEAANPQGEVCTIVVRLDPTRGWVVFVDGGLLSTGEDDAVFGDFDEALVFAGGEAAVAALGD